ncbi:2-oxoglutarate (2OG) and Fe(II)-dependent oxygenase superfamily protein [Euphorbia peplus]|nr:2-oxoglutarate (2OG) and Fe(II)-dependent oxygenase superfamily protein [Euphorbia peplus]
MLSRETMAEYRSEVKKLAERIMEVMDENLGLPKGYHKGAFNGYDTDFFGTKVSHYPPCPYPELVVGLRPHIDAGGVILLFQDDIVGGLQILKDGVWIDVQPLKNSIMINTGDRIEVLSNGKYTSIWHRVLPTPTGNRRSIASFYNPSIKVTIATAPQLAGASGDEANGSYPKFVFGDYMSVYAEQKFLPKEPRCEAVKAV